MDDSHFLAEHTPHGPLGAVVFCSLCKVEQLVWTGKFYACRECDPNVPLPSGGDAE